MAFGAVFTTSSGGSIGGPLPFTRFRGQLLAGQSPEPPASGSQTGTAVGGASGYNGSAANPLYSFYNRPDTGIYASVVTSSGVDVRFAVNGVDFMAWSLSSAAGAPQLKVLSTGGANGPANAVLAGATVTTSGPASGYVFIPQSSAGTFTTSTANTQPAGPTAQVGAAIMWDAVAKRFGVFSTVQNDWFFGPVHTSG